MPRRPELTAPSQPLLRACQLARQTLVTLSLLFCSCSAPRDDWAHVQVESRGANNLGAFHVTLASKNDPVIAFTCPASDAATLDGIRCTSNGFDLASEAAFDVTLRVTGHVFSSSRVNAVAGGTTTIRLERLPKAQNTTDYATRLDGDNCLEELEEFAIAIPTDAGISRSVKFFIRNLESSPEVYFQNTQQYPLHFEFARRVLGVEGTADQFSAEVYAPEREAIVGTLVHYPSLSGSARGSTPTVKAPWTLNFFSSDPITPEQVRLAHRLLEERLTCLRWSGPAQRLVYLPATTAKEQEASSDESRFLRAGIGWLSHQDLFGSVAIQTLNPGLAFGTLTRMTPEQLATSVVSFRDILLLTRIPNELPVVGGTITEELQTPLAHVNVAARSRGTPNLAYPEAFHDSNIAALVGKLVRFEVENGAYSLREATLEEAEAFWNERNPERYVPNFDSSLTGIPAFDEIGFADSVRVGVKGRQPRRTLAHSRGKCAAPRARRSLLLLRGVHGCVTQLGCAV